MKTFQWRTFSQGFSTTCVIFLLKKMLSLSLMENLFVMHWMSALYDCSARSLSSSHQWDMTNMSIQKISTWARRVLSLLKWFSLTEDYSVGCCIEMFSRSLLSCLSNSKGWSCQISQIWGEKFCYSCNWRWRKRRCHDSSKQLWKYNNISTFL